MLFNSLQYLIFFPVVVLGYYLVPTRYRWIWLLVASYYFYMSWNPLYALLILTSTVVTWLAGIGLEKYRARHTEQGKGNTKVSFIIAGTLITNLGILFFFKYFNFANEALASLFSMLHINFQPVRYDLLLPVGISFYTFQALGYILDVYRKTIPAERHFGKYALFVSFFPQLVAGPIERSTNLLPQLSATSDFSYHNMRSGLLLILWGIFQKVLIADRLALLVNEVYNEPDAYEGFHIIIATFLFSFQILCDFSAYSDIAIGSAKVLGIGLMKNFDRPYFASSIREFWRRWHISLSTWFKDYLYIPLGGSKGSRSRTYINIIIVFVVSGLWHGASWTFVVWGLLHGLFQVSAMIFSPLLAPITRQIPLNRERTLNKLFNVMITFSLVTFAWVFFRANSLSDALFIMRQAMVFNPEVLVQENGLFHFSEGLNDLQLACLLIATVLAVHALQRTRSLRTAIGDLWLPVRWSFYVATILIILIWGIYGIDYDHSKFIYFQF